MTPERLPPTRTPLSTGEAAQAIAQAWRDLFPAGEGVALPVRSVTVLCSQWALETARGKAMIAFNFGGIKSTIGDGRDFTYYPTHEVLAKSTAEKMLARRSATEPCSLVSFEGGGKMRIRLEPDHPGCRFRAYGSAREGAVDYLGLLRRRYANAWPAVEVGDPAAFAIELKKLGYYTASVDSYSKSLVSLAREFLPHVRRALGEDDTPLPEAIRKRTEALIAATYADFEVNRHAPDHD